jgi:hypothetical protein
MGQGNILANFVSPAVVWIVFIVVLAIFFVATVALRYHWKNYDIDENRGKRIMRIYILVSAILISIMLVAAITYAS